MEGTKSACRALCLKSDQPAVQARDSAPVSQCRERNKKQMTSSNGLLRDKAAPRKSLFVLSGDGTTEEHSKELVGIQGRIQPPVM